MAEPRPPRNEGADARYGLLNNRNEVNMKEDLLEIIAWNTGCWYTSAGQRIAAARMADGTVYFHDLDRMISGKCRTKADDDALLDGLLSHRWVHDQYLANEYDCWGCPRDVERTLRDCASKVEPLTPEQ